MEARRSLIARHAPAALLFVAWCLVSLVAVLHHEAWRDEADGWLAARDLSVTGLLRMGRYSGTPALWYLVQIPFARLGLPYGWQEVVHWPIAAGVAALVAFRAPFSLVTRGLVLFTELFVFEYAVVARGYSLTILFIFLACALHRPQRLLNMPVALALAAAANSTAFGIFFALAWQAMVAFDLARLARSGVPRAALLDRRALVAALVGAAGTLAGLLQIFPRPHDGQLANRGANLHGLGHALAGIWPYGPLPLRVLLSVALIAATLWLIRSSLRAVVVFVVFVALLCVLFGALHAGFLRHFGFFLVAIVAARWLAMRDTNASPAPSLSSFSSLLRATGRERLTVAALFLGSAQLLSSCVAGVRQVHAEVTMRFSNAEAMASWLREHHLDDRRIAAHSPTTGEAVLPYLPGRAFFYPALDDVGTYMLWTRKQEKNAHMPYPDAMALIKRRYPDWNDPARGVLLLAWRPLDDEVATEAGYRLLHAEDEPVCSPNGEHFWLYAPTTDQVWGAPP